VKAQAKLAAKGLSVPKAVPTVTASKGAAGAVTIVGEKGSPICPDKHGTVVYRQGKVNVNIDKELSRVFPNPQSKSDVRVPWARFGGKDPAWLHAIALIDGFADKK
jgi:hypothetical protein